MSSTLKTNVFLRYRSDQIRWTIITWISNSLDYLWWVWDVSDCASFLSHSTWIHRNQRRQESFLRNIGVFVTQWIVTVLTWRWSGRVHYPLCSMSECTVNEENRWSMAQGIRGWIVQYHAFQDLRNSHFLDLVDEKSSTCWLCIRREWSDHTSPMDIPSIGSSPPGNYHF